jgi:hypothetical protein
MVRLITHTIRAGGGPWRNVTVGQTHIHHMVPGILLVLITGYLSNAISFRSGRTTVAVFFGVGAALTLDEFALWLHLRDVYRMAKRVVDMLNPFFQIKSLYDFNRKFSPGWLSRMLVFEEPTDLPRVGLLYAGAEGFLAVPVVGELFIPRAVGEEGAAA